MFEVSDFSLEAEKVVLSKQETHYLDFKAREIDGKSLQKHLVGFANADGGELYIGVDEVKAGKKSESKKKTLVCRGFDEVEGANQLVQNGLLDISPTVEGMIVDFLKRPEGDLLVRFTIPKSDKVHYTSAGTCCVRLSAQTQTIKGEAIAKLAYSKGFFRYEEQPALSCSVADIVEAGHLQDFLKRVGSKQDAEKFLRRNRLLVPGGSGMQVNVGCVIMFDNDPDEVLSTKTSGRVVRMKTGSTKYNRDQLSVNDKVVGPLENLVGQVEDRVLEIMEDASFEVNGVSFPVEYPKEALHEVVVNAFLHRDYSVPDDVQITIYDNRIEVRSPGKLPGNVTTDNILDAHFARNPNLVRLVNKLPDPLNHDMGEGLDTAFRAMNSAGLVPPSINEVGNSVVVILRHKKLASYEELILEYLGEHDWITNKIVRELTGEGSENVVKSALQRLRTKKLIEPEDPDASPFRFRYRKVS